MLVEGEGQEKSGKEMGEIPQYKLASKSEVFRPPKRNYARTERAPLN